MDIRVERKNDINYVERCTRLADRGKPGRTHCLPTCVC